MNRFIPGALCTLLWLGACSDEPAKEESPPRSASPAGTELDGDYCGPDAQPHDSPATVATERDTTSNAGTYAVAWTSEPPTIPVNEPFDLVVTIREAGDGGAPVDAEVIADARMPEHAHGMNVVPEVAALGEGRYRVEGMLFHMPGSWRLTIDITEAGITERAEFDLHINP